MKKNILYFFLVVALLAVGWYLYQNTGKGVCDKTESTDVNGILTISCVQSSCSGNCTLKYRRNSENPGKWIVVPPAHVFNKNTWEYHCFCK